MADEQTEPTEVPVKKTNAKLAKRDAQRARREGAAVEGSEVAQSAAGTVGVDTGDGGLIDPVTGEPWTASVDGVTLTGEEAREVTLRNRAADALMNTVAQTIPAGGANPVDKSQDIANEELQGSANTGEAIESVIAETNTWQDNAWEMFDNDGDGLVGDELGTNDQAAELKQAINASQGEGKPAGVTSKDIDESNVVETPLPVTEAKVEGTDKGAPA